MSLEDHIPFGFGKHKGITPAQVAEFDPRYIVWFHNNVDEEFCSAELYKAACRHVDTFSGGRQYGRWWLAPDYHWGDTYHDHE